VLCIDLFCGLGGWAEGFLSEGYSVIGFDIERRPYPGQLVLQDVTTLDGAQFKDARVIVASPPCQEYSYMAMPWERGKQIARALRGEDQFPEGHTGSRNVAELNRLFLACFRIQREASEAAGRHIPMVLENVRGAQVWVGKAQAHYGSYYLWGDVESVGGRIVARKPVEFGMNVRGAVKWVGPAQGKFGSYYLWGDVPALLPVARRNGQKVSADGTHNGQGSWFKVADSKNRGTKNTGGSWFNIAHNTTSGVGRNPVHAATKQYGGNFGWDGSALRQGNSKSNARKQASALIAKIPFELARHIARVYR